MKTFKNTTLNLHDYFGANKKMPHHHRGDETEENPFFEGALVRKYNHSTRSDYKAVRLVFLNTLKREDPANHRLVKDGKPLWCFSLQYAGVCKKTGYRQISFTLSKKSKKRFCVGEQHILVIPTRVRIYPKFWDSYKQRCSNFGSLFAYFPIISMMWPSSKEFVEGKTREDFINRIEEDCPFKIGALVEPRMGLFSPWAKRTSLLHELRQKYSKATNNGCDLNFEAWCEESDDALIPPGVIISRSFSGDTKHNYYGKEKIKVQMGGKVFEDLHPNEVSIIFKKGKNNEI